MRKADTERLQRMRSAMQAEGFDALICRLPENVLFLSGYWPLNGWSFFVFPIDGEPTCIVPHCETQEVSEELWDGKYISFLFGVLGAGNPYEDIERVLKATSNGKGWQRVGYEGCFESIAPPWNTAELAVPADITRSLLQRVFGENLADATDLINSQRACKTAMEVDKLRVVNEISTFGLQAFFDETTVGINGVELVAAVERAVMTQGTGYKGARRVRAFAQVATNSAETVVSFRPMEISTLYKMRLGDVALIELAVVADGFWCDRTRVRVVGKANAEQESAFEAVKAAQAAATAKVCPGVGTGEVDEAARAVIREAGYDSEFLHVTGHGIGLRYHEPTPCISPGGQTVLKAGMVHTVEPGVYSQSIGGFRVEDDIHVTEDGAEVLGAFDRNIQ